MESHGKAICFWIIKWQKDKAFTKIRDEWETDFNSSRNKDKHIFYASLTMLENMLLNDFFILLSEQMHKLWRVMEFRVRTLTVTNSETFFQPSDGKCSDYYFLLRLDYWRENCYLY